MKPFSDKSKRELRDSIRYMRKFSWSGPAVRVAEKLRKSYERELASRKEGKSKTICSLSPNVLNHPTDAD